MARDDGGGMNPMEQPGTGKRDGAQVEVTGGVPNRKAEVFGFLNSP